MFPDMRLDLFGESNFIPMEVERDDGVADKVRSSAWRNDPQQMYW